MNPTPATPIDFTLLIPAALAAGIVFSILVIAMLALMSRSSRSNNG